MNRRRSPIAMALVLVAATAAPLAPPADAQSYGVLVPDSARIAQLGTRMMNLDRVRVVARSETFLADGPVVSSDGLRLSSITVREGFSYRTRTEPRTIPWAEIESIHVQGRSTRNGAYLGALLGTGIGLAIGAHQPCHEGFWLAGTSGNCVTRRVAPVLLGTVGGAALGALIAHRYERWQRLYP